MDEKELREIEARVHALRPGETWVGYPSVWMVKANNIEGNIIADTYEYGGDNCPHTEFIAHAREDVPALIAEVRRLREETMAAQNVEHDIRCTCERQTNVLAVWHTAIIEAIDLNNQLHGMYKVTQVLENALLKGGE